MLVGSKGLVTKCQARRKVDCDIDGVGGAKFLDERSVVCEIKCRDGRWYKPRCFLKNAKLLEVNESIIANPDLLS